MKGNLKIYLQTITPLHIGNGETFSPYNDYVFDEKSGTIYFLDQQKVENAFNALENSEEVIDDFVERVMASKNTSDTYPLKKFFENHGIHYKELARVAVHTRADVKSEVIQQLIKSGARPYIPGSSIKGAIRTALLYVHRKEDGYSIDDALLDLFGNKDKKQFHKKSPNGEDLFCAFGNDILKYLHVSDTDLLSPSEIEIVKTFRFDLRKKAATVPITKEVIPENKTLSFRLQCKANKKFHNLNERFSYLYAQNDFRGEYSILYMVNIFTKEILEKELSVLKETNIPELQQITKQYENLYKAAQQFEKERNGAVLRLGSGKTFFDQTINSLFSDHDLKKLRKRLNLDSYEPFPKTRAVIENVNLYESVLGWVYLRPLTEE
ncbi:type III-A CRISPR-associated RAMP protein Csm5 [Bacillus smithii]|uniref:type III-A CRISPR-associated RAMP protein Csm5 n=1 Tax=Bacillus smithii TaxID=1479 RepID=UPI002E1A6472|nr:type III-A CRISPR-associated RAMP protein Csm5 [Bacillus smithii]MED4927053.1 type III-A CRISPR-associated RAMP protein Csm5 [Bacillus smithii]